MRWKANLLLLLALLAQHYANSEVGLLPMSGSGSGQINLPIPSCNKTSITLNVSVFDTITDKLLQLDCTAGDEGYKIVFKSPQVGTIETDGSAIFGDYFDADTVQNFSLEVCVYDVLTDADFCSEDLISVFVSVRRHSDRLMPFGAPLYDSRLTYADDRAVGIFLSSPIPFWGSYYTSVYLSTNGVVSFGRPFTQYWPITFPYGWSSVPVIAPYWNDMDFRNYIPDSGVYYATYASSGTKRDKAFLKELSERLAGYSVANFDPKLMMVATWYKATPYYGRYNTDETLTFQVLLATDSVDTYAVFLYEEGGMNWNRASRRIIVGYDAKNYIDYLNVNGSNEDFIEMDSFTGNTGSPGEWLFQLTDSDSDLKPEQECYKWASRQEDGVFEEYFQGLPSCPCTYSQARRDWRFWFAWRWGISSGPYCATLVWSRRQSTVECCYDRDTGALLVGGISGGSFKLHHPLFSNRNYVTEDKQPYEYCCRQSKLCSIFFTYRPSDDCTGYDPSQITFMWGDPHMQTIDGLTYTFNGYGEYVLLHSQENSLSVQARLALLEPSDTDFNATVISAVVVVQGSAQPVQVERRDNGSVAIYVNGSLISLSTEEGSSVIATESVMYDSFNDFLMSEQNSSTADYVSLSYNDDNLVISTSSGASVSVSSAISVLQLAVQVVDSFINATEGLLGHFNMDSSDDLYTPDRTTLPSNSTDRDVFDYGLLWHVNEEESLFKYFGETSYSTYNDGWDTFTPTFKDEIASILPGDLDLVCEGDPQCVFDYAVSNNASFASATHATTMENQETLIILANTAPVITGDMEIYVTSGVRFEGEYSVSDEDDNDIRAFELKGPVLDNITLDSMEDGMAVLVWDNPGSELPQTAIQILANDSLGAVTVRSISFILCACGNGDCINTTTTHLYDSNGHYRQECQCDEFFSGDLCEVDDRRCTNASCPESSLCVQNSSVAAGFTCSDCQEGYELADDGKCYDIDECNTTITDDCAHNCSNTEGSYECMCFDGYKLTEDGRNCTDIDECYEGTDDCGEREMCTDTNGSYMCECIYPEVSAVGFCTVGPCTGCDTGTCASTTDGNGVCICLDPGTQCVGICEGTLMALDSGSQSCEECGYNMYGYRCHKMCDCSHGECDPVEGCMCNDGYEGEHCDSEINLFAPEFAKDTVSELKLSWNLPQGAVLVEFTATDKDLGPPGEVVYSLYHGHQLPSGVSSGSDVFSIDNETGVLALAQDLNTTRDLYERFVLTVLGTDLGGNPQSSEVVVSVLLEDTPAPIPSFNNNLYAVKISENTPNDSTVLNLTCSEPEGATGAANLTTRLVASNDSLLFSLDGEHDDLMLVLLEERDYESLENTSQPHYILQVTCTNQYDLTSTATIEIEIENEDDNAFEFDNSTYSVVVVENVPRYHEVLTVTAFDPDIPDGSITYSAFNPTTFSIYPANGTVYVTEPHVNREAQDSYTLRIQATLHSSGETTQATIEIAIADINEGPPLFYNDLYISENLTTANTVGDVALRLTAVDEDFENNGSVIYSIEANPLFAIDNRTGEIYIANESVVLHYGSHVLQVYASDDGIPPLNSSTTVDIYVAPIPEQIVFRGFPSQILISEDEPRGYEIGTIVAEVLDSNGGVIEDAQTVGNIEYTLLETNNSQHFHIGRFSGKLILLNSLDYESQPQYELSVTASIPDYEVNLIESEEITEVIVTDVNDNAPEFVSSFYTSVVEEFTDAGTSVLTVHANDADSGINAEVTYQLAENTDVPFFVDSITGVVEVSEQLTTPLDYRFYVVAKDGGTQPRSSEAILFISVVRSASITPEFDRHSYIFNVSEKYSTPGSKIGTVHVVYIEPVTDSDEYEHFEFRLQTPDMMMDEVEMFHIDPESGVVSVVSELDAEYQDQYAVYVEVYNASNVTHVFDSSTIQIIVLDENDNAPRFKQSLYTDVITTSQEKYSILFNVSADDDDSTLANSQVTYSLSHVIGFDLDPHTGEMSVVNSTLVAGEYHMTATATDEGQPIMSGTATVFIAVIPEGPQSILFERDEYIFYVSEDASPDTSVGTIVALDHNGNPFVTDSDLRYYFSNTSLTDFVDLVIGEYNGNVSVSSLLDREEKSTYKLVVFAQYEGNQTGVVKMTANVLDINDNVPIFDKDVYADLIFTTHGTSTVIIQVSAEDADAGLNGLVHYSFSDGSNQTELFRISTDTGEIYSLVEDDIPAGDYRLVVIASDSDPISPQTSTAFAFICVVHEEPMGPLQITSVEFYVDENSPIETVVGTVLLQASGMMINPTHYEGNLEFVIGGEDVPFVINRNNGTIKVVGSLDREVEDRYTLEVEVNFTEYRNIFTSALVTIYVGDLNDNSPVFNPLVYSTIIDDDYMDNQTVPIEDVIVTDRDAGTNAELEVSLDESNPFGVRVMANLSGELVGEIFVRNSSQLEPGRQYQFLVVASDKGSPSFTSLATVFIDVRHAIPDAISFPQTIYMFNHTENSEMRTPVGNVTIEQDTPALEGLVYSISGGTGINKFHIDQETGEISNHFSLDREVDEELTLIVTAQFPHHAPPLSADTSVAITILDENDNIPIFDLSSYYTAVFTNEIVTDAPLINVSASDRDVESNALVTYTISPNDTFRIDANGSIFALSDSLEVMTHSLTVEAIDMGNPPLTGLTVVIIDVRQAIPDSITFSQSQYYFNVSEYSISGTVVGTVELDPPLAQNFVQFRTFSSDSSDFVVVAQSGVVQSRRQFDYETDQNTIDFHITCTLYIPYEMPPVQLTARASVRVSIQDENDNTPQFVEFPTTLEYHENVTQDEMIVTIIATDADSETNARLTFTILNEVLLRIDSETGQLFVRPGLDREQQVTHIVSILVEDSGDPPRSSQSDIELTLLDINDNIPVLAVTEFNVDERVTGVVFTLEYSDSDEGEFGRATFIKILSESDSRFSVDSTTGQVTLTEELDFETDEEVSILVELRDNPSDQTNSNAPQYTVKVNVIDRPDNVPVFDDTAIYSIAIDPGITTGGTLITVHATDRDNDVVTYSIASSTADFVDIDPASGEIYFTQTVTLDPGSDYEIGVVATDDSEYALSSSVMVEFRIDARSLTFDKDEYTGVVHEDAESGYSIQRMRIQELARSGDYEYEFTYRVVVPLGADDPFMTDLFTYRIDILVDDPLDRETVPMYVLEITASRINVVPANTDPDPETTKINLTITVEDVNDNSPRISAPEPVYRVAEDAVTDTEVARVIATDSDLGLNSQLVYSIVDPVGSPFKVDGDGIIAVRQSTLDYESLSSYVLTVEVEDLGEPSLSSTAQFTVQVVNVNDMTPGFAALAYFGELYTGAAANSLVYHTLLEASDADGDTEFTFSVIPDPSDASAAGYSLSITNVPPYRIVANAIPPSAESGLRKFTITISDGLHTNSSVLYLGVFAQKHLLPMTIAAQQSEEEFLTIIDSFLEILSEVFSSTLGQPVSYYYQSLEPSSTDTTVLIMNVYGWYGDYGTRYTNGQEPTGEFSNSVSYIDYDDVEEATINSVAAAVGASTGFDVEIDEAPGTTTGETTPAAAADNTALAGIVSGSAIAALVIVLLIVAFVAVGRRKKPKPEKDPYNLSYSGRHRHDKRTESIPLTEKAASSDLAYETMNDDDDMLNQPQTMPWFDPNYLAPNQYEGYDGDVEQSTPKGGLRATVDGDAKRNRRHSSDESAGGGSVSDLDPSKYLHSYQQATPMKPGQRMGEFDMFLKQDGDKPRRPSLHNITASPSRGQPRKT